jgi:hypothetical protein
MLPSTSSSAAATDPEAVNARVTPPSRPRRPRAPTAGDVLLLLALVAAIPLAHRAAGGTAGAALLQVQCDGQPERDLDPRRDADVVVRGPVGETTVRLRGGVAWIESAPCRNQLCRRMGRIDRPGRALVCLPNRVLVRFAGRAPDLDAISR